MIRHLLSRLTRWLCEARPEPARPSSPTVRTDAAPGDRWWTNVPPGACWVCWEPAEHTYRLETRMRATDIGSTPLTITSVPICDVCMAHVLADTRSSTKPVRDG